MTRIAEILIALLITALIALGIGVMLPSKGEVHRSITVANPVRLAFDTVDGFRRYPQWSGLAALDPAMQFSLSGPDTGPGAKVSWTSNNSKIGDGSMEILSHVQDKEVEIALDNDWLGTNKLYRITLEPSENRRTLTIHMDYTVDYGWDLKARYAGLYIHGTPDTVIQESLSRLSAMMAGYPNTDYTNQKIELVDVEPRPVFLVNTASPRTLDDVEEATDAAMEKIQAAIEKAGLEAAGPRMTITTRWAEDEYGFAVAVPVNAASFTLDDETWEITTPVRRSAFDEDEEEEEAAAAASSDDDEDADDEDADTGPKTGEMDREGMLVVEGDVRAAMWYGGKALMSEHTGSPAMLPAMRTNLKAYAETHGYPYSEVGLGRYWDELVSDQDAESGEESFRVYLPVQR